MAVEIPPWLDPAETLLFAAACIKSGRVRFCPPTIDKMAIHPLGAALSFKADDPVDASRQSRFAVTMAGEPVPPERCSASPSRSSGLRRGGPVARPRPNGRLPATAKIKGRTISLAT